MGQFTNLHSEKYTNLFSGNTELFFRKHNYVQETPLVRKTFGRRPLAEPLAEPLAVEICFSFRTDTRWSSYSNEPRPQTRSSNPPFSGFELVFEQNIGNRYSKPCWAVRPGARPLLDPCPTPVRPLPGPCPAPVLSACLTTLNGDVWPRQVCLQELILVQARLQRN